MLDFKIDDERCIRCGLCVADCPYGVIALEQDQVPYIPPDREDQCIRCQHCMAVCPKGALSILGCHPDDSITLKGAWPTHQQMDALIRGRRSIRKYRNQNVDRALLDSLMKTLANAPRGVNYQDLNCHLIDDCTIMDTFRSNVYSAIKQAAAENRLPESFGFIVDALPAFEEHGSDLLMRGAPHALIISESAEAPCPEQDIALTLAYFELLAQCAGLGTVWCGMLKRALEALPELKDAIGLPRDHIYYPIMFGLPAIAYTRTVQRDAVAKIHRITLGS